MEYFFVCLQTILHFDFLRSFLKESRNVVLFCNKDNLFDVMIVLKTSQKRFSTNNKQITFKEVSDTSYLILSSR